MNAILYFLRAGCAWRLLPHEFPPWQTVYYYLRRWQREGVWDQVHHILVMADRERAGRDASPSAAILDSQGDGLNSFESVSVFVEAYLLAVDQLNL